MRVVAAHRQVDWFILPSHNLTDESERGLTFHHSRLMGLDDLLNTVGTARGPIRFSTPWI